MRKKNIHAWDIHIHSHHSPDSRSKIERIFEVAKSKGLEGVAITDHGTLAGYFEARPFARKYGIGLVAGYEYRAAEGDVVVLGVKKMPPGTRLPTGSVVDFAHSLGGVVIAVHPFDPFRAGIGGLLGKIKVDAVETLNCHCLIYGNEKAAKVALAHSRAQVGGSDAHAASEVGNGFTVFAGQGDILRAIKAGRTRAAGGINLPTFPEAIGSNILTLPSRLEGWLANLMRTQGGPRKGKMR